MATASSTRYSGHQQVARAGAERQLDAQGREHEHERHGPVGVAPGEPGGGRQEHGEGEAGRRRAAAGGAGCGRPWDRCARSASSVEPASRAVKTTRAAKRRRRASAAAGHVEEQREEGGEQADEAELGQKEAGQGGPTGVRRRRRARSRGRRRLRERWRPAALGGRCRGRRALPGRPARVAAGRGGGDAHEVAGQAQRLGDVARVERLAQAGQLLPQQRAGQRPAHGHGDLGVARADDLLAVVEELLVELLAAAVAGEDDLDVAVDLEAREPDHLAREVDDAHRARPCRARRSRRRCRSAPAWITSRTASGMVMKKRVMRSSVTVIGPPAAICSLEERHHAAARAEHVAEAHGHEPRVGGLARHGLDDALGERLGQAHHRLGLDRLVGRDEHEASDAEAHRRSRPATWSRSCCCRRPRPGLLHHRHVLVGRRVKDDVGALRLEQGAQLDPVADVDAGRRRGR